MRGGFLRDRRPRERRHDSVIRQDRRREEGQDPVLPVPRRGGRTVTVDAVHPEIHKYCPAFNAEWITGLSHGD